MHPPIKIKMFGNKLLSPILKSSSIGSMYMLAIISPFSTDVQDTSYRFPDLSEELLQLIEILPQRIEEVDAT